MPGAERGRGPWWCVTGAQGVKGVCGGVGAEDKGRMCVCVGWGGGIRCVVGCVGGGEVERNIRYCNGSRTSQA